MIDLVLAALLLIPSSASAAEGVQQPYIDSLKQGLPAQESAESYTEKLQQELKSESPSESYSDTLRKTLPADEDEGTSFTESLKTKLPAKSDESAIQALKDGKSELKANKSLKGSIHQAAGFRLSASSSRTITESGGAANGAFFDYYEKGWVPELAFFYEYQPFHSETFGNIGIVGGGGFTFQKGTGVFRVGNLPNPYKPGENFGSKSQTRLRFVTVPLTLGLNYRFNLLNYVRPYVQASGALIGYIEMRSDNKGDRKGKSTGFQFSGGTNILLDGIFKGASWDVYDVYGVKHYYLTIDYTKLTTVAGDLSFDASTVSLGLTYEF